MRWGLGRVPALIGAAIIALVAGVVVLALRAVEYVRPFDESAQELLRRARVVRERAHPEYNDEVLATLGASSYNGAFYRLDEMLGDAVSIDEPVITAEALEAGLVLAFEFEDRDPIRLEPSLGDMDWRVANGLLSVGYHPDDYLSNSEPLRIFADPIGAIHIRARSSNTTTLWLGWSKEQNSGNPWENAAKIDLIGDGKFHTYVINAKNALRRGLSADDVIRRLFLRPVNSSAGAVDIDFIRFVSKLARYLEAARGLDYETVGGEMRRVLYMLPPQTLEFSLRVPAASPTLNFGAATLMDGSAITFTITIVIEDGSVVPIHSQTISDSARWRDIKLDLASWAGQNIRLRLGVAGSGENVALWSSPLVSSAPSKRFNVILVVEDTLRADHLSSYGYHRSTSPVKDQLMKEGGVVFLNAISQATKTRASIPTLMTSLFSTATGVWTWGEMLSDKYVTLAEVMRSQGFVTASFIQNGNAGPYNGIHQGFDVLRDERILGQTTEDAFGKQILDWVNDHRDRNFFLYVHLVDPHGPYDPPPPFDRDFRELPKNGTSVKTDSEFDPSWVENSTEQGRILLYDGEIRHNDAQLRPWLRSLDSVGVLENALLIFTSDHGEYLGERNNWGHHPPGLFPVIGIPMMFYYPSRFSEPQRIPQAVQLIDVMPTILDLAGIDTSKLVMQGASLVDLIEGRDLGYWNNRITVSEEPSEMSKQAPCPCGSLIFRQWHLISSNQFSGLPRVRTESRAFDYHRNRSEIRASFAPVLNYLAWFKARRVIRELQAINIETWKNFTKGESQEQLPVDPDVLERLRALGYLQ